MTHRLLGLALFLVLSTSACTPEPMADQGVENGKPGKAGGAPAVSGPRLDAPWIVVDADAADGLAPEGIYHQGPEPPRAVTWDPLPEGLEAESGDLIVEVILDQKGRVARVRLLRGPEVSGVAEAVARHLAGWRFEPARLRGKPVPVYYLLDLRSKKWRRPPADPKEP